MSVGDTAPLITIGHDWSTPPELARRYPTAVIPHDTGSEQRLALSHLPIDRMTYRLLPPEARDASILLTLADVATDTIVRVPRWEDQARVSTAGVTAGSGAVIPCDTTNKPTFVVGGQVILWRDAHTYEVTTATAVASGSVTATLVSNWAAGTIIAPVMPGRLVLPFSRTHWAPTTGALTLVVEFDVRDIAGIGTGGTGAAGVPYAISVGDVSVSHNGRSPIVATVTDSAGNRLSGQPVVWTSADATNAPVYATSDPQLAMVSNPNSLGGVGLGTTVAITGTLGALSDSGTARLFG